jgi:hypothetical protein
MQCSLPDMTSASNSLMSSACLSLSQTLSNTEGVPPAHEDGHNTSAPTTACLRPESDCSEITSSIIPSAQQSTHQAERIESKSTNRGQLHYIARADMVPQSLLDHWNNELHPQIVYHLKSLMSPGAYALCLVVASEKHQIASKMKPSIIIQCTNFQQYREIKRSFQKHIWKTRFKKAGCKPRILVEEGFDEIGGVFEDEEMAQALDFQHRTQKEVVDVSATLSSPGRLIWKERSSLMQAQGEYERFPSTSVATLGGLVKIDDQIFGLTVAHPFVPRPPTSRYSDTQTFVERSASSGNDCHDDFADDSEDVFSDSSDETGSVPYSPMVSLQDRETGSVTSVLPLRPHKLRSQDDSCCKLAALCLGDQFEISSHSISKRVDHQSDNNPPDWALFELEVSCLLPNSYVERDQRAKNRRTSITEIMCSDLLSAGEVNVIAARSGTILGHLSAAIATISLRGRQISVRHIRLDSRLGK